MQDKRVEVDIPKAHSNQSFLSPTTTTNETFPPVIKTDGHSKSFNAVGSPTTAVNLMIPTPALMRKPSFNEFDSPMTDVSILLQNLPFFSGLPSTDQFIQEISGFVKVRTFKAGDTVLRYGDVAKCMYLIVKGELAIMSEDNEIEYATLTTGSFVGEIGVLFNTVRTATVTCKTKCLLVSLMADDINTKLDIYPDIREHLQLKGKERMQALEEIKNSSKSRPSEKETKGKAGFSVMRSSSFKKPTSPNTSFNSGQFLSTSANLTGGLAIPDDINLMKNRSTARRSSVNPETILDVALEIPDELGLTHKEPIFNRRKSYNPIYDDSQKLSKPLNATRRKSCIRFELGDLAVSATDDPFESGPQTDNSDVKILVDCPLESNIEMSRTTGDDEGTIELFVPTINIESASVQNLAAVEDKTPLESIEDKLKSTETEARRVSVAVWSDPKLLQQSHKREEGYVSGPKTMRKGCETSESSFVENDDEKTFLNSSATTATTDSLDELNSLSPAHEVISYSLKYLNFVDLFKIRGISKDMAELITSNEQVNLKNVNFAPYFRKLNDKGLIAFAKLFGENLEKINLHAGWQLTDKGIETLAKHAPNLLYLNLSEVWELTNASLKSIAKYCPSIEHLDLSNCRKITNNGLLTILESCQISKLSLSYCKNLTNKVLDHDGWQRIKELNLHRCTGIADRGFEFWPLLVDEFTWAASRSIRQLALSTDWQIASEDGLQAGDLTQDQTILANDLTFDDKEWNMDNEDYYDSDSKDVLTSEYLSSQEGPNFLVTEASLDNKNPSNFDLISLDLRDCSFLSDAAIASIASVCSNLRILNLSFCCSLTEDFGRYLGCKKLSELDVSFCGAAVTDELILELCSGLHRLSALSIRGCVQITDIGVDHIVKHSRLKKINFSQCKSISSEASKILHEKYEVIDTASVCEAIAAWDQ